MIIQHNLLVMTANRNYKINANKYKKSVEKLSSGFSINRSSDGPAEVSISEKMRSQIRGLMQNSRNIQDGISFVQTADGALGEVQAMMQRMRELGVQAANDTNTDEERESMDMEVQQLKQEMDKIFSDTEFNTKKIWKPEGEKKVQTGTEEKQFITVTSSSTIARISQANKDVIPYGSITISADKDAGVSFKWKGYNGTDYQTETVSWEDFKAAGYSTEISDYFNKDTSPELFSADTPVFNKKITFNILDEATTDDIAKALNGKSLIVNKYVDIDANYKSPDGTPHGSTSNGVGIRFSMNYNAAYVAAADMDNKDDIFFEALTTPTAGNVSGITSGAMDNVTTSKSCSDIWKFTFDMPNIGTVTSKINSIYSTAPSDTSADDEGYWWKWTYPTNGTPYKSAITHNATTKDIKGLMGLLTGSKASGHPGLLTGANGGDADSGGTISLSFTLNSATPYTLPDGRQSSSVGTLYLTVNVQNTDTEQSVLNKINSALNAATIIDGVKSNGTSNSNYMYLHSPSSISNKIEVPIYGYITSPAGDGRGMMIQAGPSSNQSIGLQYETLSTNYLGLKDTNVLTGEAAGKCLAEIDDAFNLISNQRSRFGAYQNRLEYALSVADSMAENTTASESRIRDTQMYREIMENARSNILMQVGQSMIAQAKNMDEGILQLLQI